MQEMISEIGKEGERFVDIVDSLLRKRHGTDPSV